MLQVLKHEIPIDDQRHSVDVQKGIVHVGHQRFGVVTVWFLGRIGEPPSKATTVSLRAYGTGHLVEDTLLPSNDPHYSYSRQQEYVGTAIDHGTGLVWHLFKET